MLEAALRGRFQCLGPCLPRCSVPSVPSLLGEFQSQLVCWEYTAWSDWFLGIWAYRTVRGVAFIEMERGRRGVRKLLWNGCKFQLCNMCDVNRVREGQLCCSAPGCTVCENVMFADG